MDPLEKRRILVKNRLAVGFAFNLLLLYWIFNIAPKAYSSTQYHYIAIDLGRDAVSCFLPLLAIPLLLPVIRFARGWRRLLGCALLVFPVAFSCVACSLLVPEFLNSREAIWRGECATNLDLIFERFAL
jgi:hypothetical protein